MLILHEVQSNCLVYWSYTEHEPELSQQRPGRALNCPTTEALNLTNTRDRPNKQQTGFPMPFRGHLRIFLSLRLHSPGILGPGKVALVAHCPGAHPRWVEFLSAKLPSILGEASITQGKQLFFEKNDGGKEWNRNQPLDPLPWHRDSG